jgi:hypothetical protein
MIEATWHPQELKREMDATLRRVVQRVVLDRLLDLAAEADATPEVRNAVFLHLAQLAGRLRERQPDDPGEKAHIFRALCDIERVVPHSAVR